MTPATGSAPGPPAIGCPDFEYPNVGRYESVMEWTHIPIQLLKTGGHFKMVCIAGLWQESPL